MAKEIELRRHTDSDGDALTDEGVRAALEVGGGLRGGYELLVSSGAQRATQTLACFACALGERVPGGALVEPGLRSELEDRWRRAYQEAGSGELGALRSADPELVAEDSAALGAALKRVLDRLSDGGKALVVGHSPTNEAAVLGLTGEIVQPISKGAGVLLVVHDEDTRVGAAGVRAEPAAPDPRHTEPNKPGFPDTWEIDSASSAPEGERRAARGTAARAPDRRALKALGVSRQSRQSASTSTSQTGASSDCRRRGDGRVPPRKRSLVSWNRRCHGGVASGARV